MSSRIKFEAEFEEGVSSGDMTIRFFCRATIPRRRAFFLETVAE
jgi:hypothetical protein